MRHTPLPRDWSATSIRLGLDRIAYLVDRLNLRPWRFSAILVTGTNGKGSTCVFLHRILREHGVWAGLFTSPHLQSVEERIVVGDVPVSSDEFQATWDRVWAVAHNGLRRGYLQEAPTYFEALTAAALTLMTRHEVVVAVLEIGMGGRYDATNVVDPTVTIITHIDYDHESFLGDSLQAIAEEKFGITRPGVPLVTAERRTWLRRQWRVRLSAMGSPMIALDEATHIEAVHRWGHYTVRAETPFGTLPWTRLALPGRHQVENALLALWGAYLWCQKARLPFDMRRACRALTQTVWPGRLEWWWHPTRPPVLLDGAHNRDGIRQCAVYLRQQPFNRWTILFGCLRDKPWAAMIRTLQPFGTRWGWIRVPGSDRSWNPSLLQTEFRRMGIQNGTLLTDDTWFSFLTQASTPVLVVGSLYLVGYIRRHLPALGYRICSHPMLAPGREEVDNLTRTI